MRGKRFWTMAGLGALLLLAGCRCWCDRNYPCSACSGYTYAPAYAAPAAAPVCCVPCCPAPPASGYAPAPPPPDFARPHRTGGICDCP
jgi:hypothetical protein